MEEEEGIKGSARGMCWELSKPIIQALMHNEFIDDASGQAHATKYHTVLSAAHSIVTSAHTVYGSHK